MKASVFIGTSLDGFIAPEDGSIDWLHEVGDEPGEDYGYGAFFDSVDALVMGRNTFDLVLAFPEWPYGTKPVIVLTSRPLESRRRCCSRRARGPSRRYSGATSALSAASRSPLNSFAACAASLVGKPWS